MTQTRKQTSTVQCTVGVVSTKNNVLARAPRFVLFSI